MQKLPLRNLNAGMTLADDITTRHGQVVARKGTVLTDPLIARLSFYRIDLVPVEQEETPDEHKPLVAPLAVDLPTESITPLPQEEARRPKAASTPPPKPEVTLKKEKNPDGFRTNNKTIPYSQKLRSTPEYQKFQLDYSRNIALMRSVFESIVKKGETTVDFERILNEVRSLFASKTTLDLFDILHTMTALDDAVYVHSLNVALISRGIGKWMKLDKDKLDVLTLAGYFHDIGKIVIPPEVLNKTGKLTDEEFQMIRKHPLEGRKLLKQINGIDGRILAATLQHHERFDGSGYPRGLAGDEIDTTAAIVAVADVYDAMTASRTYRAPKCAFQVISDFEDDGLQKYDPKVIMTFIKRMADAYQNARVILSDGSRCKVIYLNPQRMSKPMVEFDDGKILDLSTSSGISITSII
jgi:HD-GYP domain-containing protein (c-di-GMP phosphodiesterase class II)